MKGDIDKVETPVRWKVDRCYLLNTHTDGLDAKDLLLTSWAISGATEHLRHVL